MVIVDFSVSFLVGEISCADFYWYKTAVGFSVELFFSTIFSNDSLKSFSIGALFVWFKELFLESSCILEVYSLSDYYPPITDKKIYWFGIIIY